MKSPNWITKLKHRWGITSTWQVIIILLVFALTGTSTLEVEALVVKALNIQTHLFIGRALVFLFLTLPIYNMILLIIGFLFGQFRFFWSFEKRFFRSLLKFFTLPFKLLDKRS